jgi:exosortase
LDYSTDKSNDRVLGFSALAWLQIVTVAVLMCALFRFNLARLWGKTNPINGQDPNWQHSVFVPLIGLYYLYIHREELLRAAQQRPRQYKSIRVLASIGLAFMGMLAMALVHVEETGFPLMLVGALAAGLVIPVVIPTATALGSVLLLEGLIVFGFGIFPGQNDYVKDLGMVITLFGVATLLGGWAVMKIAWFPIAFLVVALPWPELVYAKLAWPLQQLAASVAVGTLRMFGVDAQNFGTRIMMVDMHGNQRLLNVAEACAGLKSVMTFLMVAGTVAFLGSRALWEKAVITVSAIPIAIFCNVMRVSGQGLLDRYVSHEWSEGFAHQFAGLVMVIPGFFMILAIGWILEKLFIEEVDKNELAIAGANAGRGKRTIVEVPRRKELEAAQPVIAPSASDAVPVVEPVAAQHTAPVAPPPVARPRPVAATAPMKPAAAPVKPATAQRPAQAPAAPRTAQTPTAPRPASTPAAPRSAAVPSTLKSSTLKSSPVNRPAAPAQGASTLKPSSKPPAARATPAAPPSTLKPSTLKPSAPKSNPQERGNS